MTTRKQTVIVTGGSQGIGAGVVNAFLARGYSVVASSRNITRSGAFEPADNLALIDGNIADPATAEAVAQMARSRFGSIDVLINNAGIYFSKPFTEYTAEDLGAFLSVNVEGFVYITQAAIRQMLAQNTGGSIVSVSASLANHPIAGVNAAVPMITKGGIESATRNLALEYAKHGIRVNAVAPGVVGTTMHESDAQESVNTRSPMGETSKVKDVVDAILYLTEADQVTGEVLHVDGGAHAGKW